MKPKLIVIAGPTATGKSALAVRLAKERNGEVISADSMQVYQGMDIGTAKITRTEMQGVPHHLIDVLAPSEDFNVCRFQAMAKEALAGIYARGHLPIIAGGTGFYIQALLYDISFAKEDNAEVTKHLEDRASSEGGADALYAELREKDPSYAKTLHPHNVKKVIRALSYITLHNEPFSAHNAREQEKTSPYDFSYFVLTDEREALYRRIDERVNRMLKNGLVDEVKALAKQGLNQKNVSMQGLGYKEILDYLDGACSLAEAAERIKQETRHFAKRQLTWFRREKEVIWLNRADFSGDDTQILSELMARAGL